MQKAKCPIIITGGGTIYSEAWPELKAFAEEFCIAVTETQAGKGALNWNHPWNAGPIGSNGGISANELAKETDLILALGTRLTDFTTASRSQFQNQAVRFVGINVAPMDASKLAALPVVADVKRTLPELAKALRDAGYKGTQDGYRQRLGELKEQWDNRVTEIRTIKEDGGALTEIGAIGLINEAVGGKATVVCATGICPGNYCDCGVRRNQRHTIWSTVSLVWATRFLVASG